MDNWNASQHPWVFRRRRAARIRPYLDRPVGYWSPPVAGCCFAAVNPIAHPCPLPSGDAVAYDTAPLVPQRPAAVTPPPLEVLQRVRTGLQALPERRVGDAPSAMSAQSRDERTALVRFIDAERARTVADRTPTEEIPVITAGGTR